MNAAAPASRRFVRGWVVLFGLFLIMLISSGFAFYAQGVFLKALIDEQGFSTGLSGGGVGVFFATSGFVGYWTGKLIDRYDVRWMMTVGAVIGGVGMAALGEVREPWQLFVVMPVFGCGFAMTGLVPTTTVVMRWFQARRSVALAIASTGLSVGGIAIAQPMGRLIDADSLVFWAPRFALVFGASILVMTWLFVKPTPESVGLRPDGAPPDEGASGPPPAPPGTPFAVAVRSRYFVLVSVGFVLIMGSQVGAIQHAYNLISGRIDIAAAGLLALTVLPVTSVVARIAGGVVALKVPLIRLTTLLIVVQGVGVCLLAVSDGITSLLVGTVVLGLAMGNLLMLHPVLLADAFGVREYGRIYGMGSLLMVIGVGSGPPLVGVLRDLYSYRTAFFALGALATVGLVVFRMAGRPPPIQTPVAAGAPSGAVSSVAEKAVVEEFEPQLVGAGTPSAVGDGTGASEPQLVGAVVGAAERDPRTELAGANGAVRVGALVGSGNGTEGDGFAPPARAGASALGEPVGVRQPMGLLSTNGAPLPRRALPRVFAVERVGFGAASNHQAEDEPNG